VHGLSRIALAALLALACTLESTQSTAHERAPAPRRCEELAVLNLREARIESAVRVPAGGFISEEPAPPAIPPSLYRPLPAFCRVQATASPTPDSRIRFEVWLPEEDWNGKLMGTGNGGAQGAIFHFAMAAPLQRGYAVVNSDTGHSGDSADWSFAVEHPEKLTDYAWRAVHEMTVHAKAIARARYARAPRFSYWTGCSSGGRQGLVEAQRFPGDYDGIIAGAPANAWVPLMVHTVLVQRALAGPDGLAPAKLAALHEAALAACDADDRVTDRIIGDPERCAFDPEVVHCARGNAPGCLTGTEVERAREIYRGAVSPRTGERSLPGPAPGSELEWLAYTGFPIGENWFRDLVFADPAWSVRAFDFDADVERARRHEGGQLDATDPDLSEFASRGGKLLLWHGWSDGLIPAASTLQYHRAVHERLGARARDSLRLYMAPGVNHCWGGEGPYQIDALGALERWVERGEAPERISASRPLPDGGTRTRPLCPYPQLARYRGEGNTDDEASFECRVPGQETSMP
jgi:feruloyl esterase